MVRAWRATKDVLIEDIATETYRPTKGQSIAIWSPELRPEEVARALGIEVTEVSVFDEDPPPISEHDKLSLKHALKPSKAFPGSFGERTSIYEDGPTQLYLARFEGDRFALENSVKPLGDNSVLVKIGISNDPSRRAAELNAGFPPKAIGRWSIVLTSEAYESWTPAKEKEDHFKREAPKSLDSLGGEFFCGEWNSAKDVFLQVIGTSRSKD